MTVPEEVVEILLRRERKVSMALVTEPAEAEEIIACGSDMMEVIACVKDGDVYFVYGFLHSFRDATPQ